MMVCFNEETKEDSKCLLRQLEVVWCNSSQRKVVKRCFAFMAGCGFISWNFHGLYSQLLKLVAGAEKAVVGVVLDWRSIVGEHNEHLNSVEVTSSSSNGWRFHF
ncbi:hypothetical protein LINGRAHAP2_LOCUS30254 [Linum grandiflorum]